MINIVLFGAPGCGKGTQAQRLKEHYGIDHVSTGEVIRDEIRRGTELGRSMEQYIKEGRLAPDEIVIGMIANYVAGHKEAKGCIFDGFPRTTVQAEEFDRILAGHGLKVDIMVDIHVPEEELVKRTMQISDRLADVIGLDKSYPKCKKHLEKQQEAQNDVGGEALTLVTTRGAR